jgi:imidazoleglycerol phosphate synthase glutamine amidotransferase subunit HisH
MAIGKPTVHLLDYVAGNVRSLVNAIEKLGFEVAWIKTPDQIASADVSGLVSSSPYSDSIEQFYCRACQFSIHFTCSFPKLHMV